MAESRSPKATLLPAVRIRTIMKSSPEITSISQESLFLITKTTELFVQCLTQEALKKSPSSKNVVYNDIATVVNDEDPFQFLADVVPKKILAGDYLEMMRQQERSGGDH